MDLRVAGFSMTKEVWFITQNEFKQVFEQQVDRCRVLLTRKTKEYTGDNADRLSAFKAAAALQSCTPERALAGMLAKHIVSLYDMCFADNAVFRPEEWDEKITDSINYLVLLRAIVKEGEENRQN